MITCFLPEKEVAHQGKSAKSKHCLPDTTADCLKFCMKRSKRNLLRHNTDHAGSRKTHFMTNREKSTSLPGG